jgi:8-oxo-dGTP pyrophosphatase MutT (NUDIX family)
MLQVADWLAIPRDSRTRRLEAVKEALHKLPDAPEERAEGWYYAHGFTWKVEVPKGGTRRGHKLTLHYGHVDGTEGADGEGIDFFMDPEHLGSELFFVVNQKDLEDGGFDEHKVMVGCESEEKAREKYLENYPPGLGDKLLGKVRPMTLPQFTAWVRKGDMEKPAADAPGLPSRQEYGDLAKLRQGALLDLFVQRHLAERAGPHFDVRVGDPDLGLYSWATRHELPSPGQKRMWVRQPLHAHEYGGFEGTIPEGYGKGEVRKHAQRRIVLTKTAPGELHFTTADRRHPERFAMIQTQGHDWLVLNTTPTKALPHAKVRYARVPAEEVEDVLGKLQPGSSVQTKIDGASSLVKLLRDGVEMVSYRTAKDTGHPIVHTERFFGGHRPKLEVPKELVGTVLRGELYGVRGRPGEERAIHPAELGGILNATIANSLAAQARDKVQLRNMLFDVQQLGKQPVDLATTPYARRRRMLEDVMARVPLDRFHLPEEVHTPSEAVALWKRITGGGHPLSEEGVVVHPATGRPTKIKKRPDFDVHLTGVYPGEGKYRGLGAGGFTYSLHPGGATVGRVGTGLSDAMRRELHDDPQEYLGRVARIAAQGQFPSGAYRAPSFIALHEDEGPPAAKLAEEGCPEGGCCPYCGAGQEYDVDDATCDRCGEKVGQEKRAVISRLREAKERSDRGDMRGKADVLRRLIRDTPGEWEISDGKGKYPGITHVPTKFRFHAPRDVAALVKDVRPFRERSEVYALKDGKVFGGLYGNGAFGVFGGGVDPGETPEEAAAREFGEEAGYGISNVRPVPGVGPFELHWKPPYATEAQRERAKKYKGSRTSYFLGDLGEKHPLPPGGPGRHTGIGLYDLDEALEHTQHPIDDATLAQANANRQKVLRAIRGGLPPPGPGPDGALKVAASAGEGAGDHCGEGLG